MKFSSRCNENLTIGLSVSLAISIYAWHEFNYDQFQPNFLRTYRVLSATKNNGENIFSSGFSEVFGGAIKQRIPEVEDVFRYSSGFKDIILESDKSHHFKEKGIGFADTPFLDLMGYRLLKGNAHTALKAPGSIVLTNDLSKKYFGEQNPIGKTIIVEKHYPLTVTAVIDKLPTNSIVQFNGLISLNSMPKLTPQFQFIYEEAGFLDTYIVLRHEVKANIVEKKIRKISIDAELMDASANFFIEPISSLHLDSKKESNGVGRRSLYILLTISFIVLALAIINYISLTTARATKRSREVGIRKAIGCQRIDLIKQFLIEAFLITSLAFVGSIIILVFFFPWSSSLFGFQVEFASIFNYSFLIIIATIWLCSSLLVGLYPAMVLSSFSPITAIQKKINLPNTGFNLRKILTAVQFSISICLFTFCLFLFKQLNFLQNKNLGLNKDQVVSLYFDGEMTPHYTELRDILRKWAGSNNVAATDRPLFTENILTYFLKTKKTKKDLLVNSMTVDASFFHVMGVQWQFSPEKWKIDRVNKELTVYNQETIKEAGINGNPLNQSAPFENLGIDGVIKDFRISSLHKPMSPMMITIVSDTSKLFLANSGYLLIRLNDKINIQSAISQLEEIYKSIQPTAPFDYYFLDDAYNKLYTTEKRLSRLIYGFTFLTIIVACLGLLGLITFLVEVRMKEISIRKVLGASSNSILFIFYKEFIKILLVSFFISLPISWWSINSWLQNFYSRIDINFGGFAFAGMLITVLALCTITIQLFKASIANPVKYLRSE